MTQPPPRRRVPLGLAGTVAEELIRPLQAGYLADRSDAVSTLAQLRRAVGKTLSDSPEVWGLTCDERLVPADFSHAGSPSPREKAVHIALTLYALHQQSRRTSPMHVSGWGLGEAVRRMMPGTEIDEPLRKRLVAAGSANSVDGVAVRLREIVSRLRQSEIPLDYGLLADQLDQAQRPGGMSRVRLAWGRGFHAPRNHDSETTTTANKDAA